MASSADVAITRAYLAEAVRAVRYFFPEVAIKDAWVYKVGRDHYEFHGPKDSIV